MTQEQQTYVFEGVEVKKTGRVAQQKRSSGKIDELVEVTPADHMIGSWKKWTRNDVLFEIQK